ncbi:MAG: dihydrodipicolinate synthase family protein [Desulfurococcus sp.]|uniref:dihydrodipicolinate synthase family protein n=1 Tax=Desulfurococcus sp. TaxID=51678 RepID=UPI003162A520
MRVHGIITALLTPLNKDLTLCNECLKNLIEFQASKGVAGIYLTGTAGEGIILPVKTRIELFKKALEYAPSNIYLLPHIGAASIDVVLELAREVKDLGYKDVSLISPIFHKPTRKGMIRFFEEVSSRTELNIVIYNNKNRQGYNISPDDFQAIVDAVRSVIGIKDTSKDVDQLLEYVKRFSHKYFIAGAGDELILYTFLIGAHAHICAVSNVIPEIVVELYKTVTGGDIKKAVELQYKINGLRKQISKIPVESQEVLRQLASLRGLKPGYPPLQLDFDYDEKTIGELKVALNKVLGDMNV